MIIIAGRPASEFLGLHKWTKEKKKVITKEKKGKRERKAKRERKGKGKEMEKGSSQISAMDNQYSNV